MSGGAVAEHHGGALLRLEEPLVSREADRVGSLHSGEQRRVALAEAQRARPGGVDMPPGGIAERVEWIDRARGDRAGGQHHGGALDVEVVTAARDGRRDRRAARPVRARAGRPPCGRSGERARTRPPPSRRAARAPPTGPSGWRDSSQGGDGRRPSRTRVRATRRPLAPGRAPPARTPGEAGSG